MNGEEKIKEGLCQVQPHPVSYPVSYGTITSSREDVNANVFVIVVDTRCRLPLSGLKYDTCHLTPDTVVEIEL